MRDRTLTEKLFFSHLVEGEMTPGKEISLKIDQTLTQDATGTLVMLELEAMQLKKAKTQISAQYVDHNLLQTDFKNADDHLFLQSCCEKFGIFYSPAGRGISHPLHMEKFGKPGSTLLGSDSHTSAAGSLGMLAMGAGGLDVALAIAGHPFTVKMPKVVGVQLTGKLPPWVSAKDIILEILRRKGVAGGVGKVFEYFGEGLQTLTVMDRHVIANMGAELGATTSVFPSDENTRIFLQKQNREEDYIPLSKDEEASFDEVIEMDLSSLEPLIACPSSPGNVVPVKEVEGRKIYQSMIGSSANPGLRDFAVVSLLAKGKKLAPWVSLEINPSTKQVLENLSRLDLLFPLIEIGARIHQAGCNGCIGMGQAPATNKISLRTVPRNFPGRSGTKEDQVYLCSPETAMASALTGYITDPRSLGKYPYFEEPEKLSFSAKELIPKPASVPILRGPNIKPLPSFAPLPANLQGPVLLKLSDNITTDEILPAGSEVLPYRSNIYEIAKFCFSRTNPTFYKKALSYQERGFFILAGANYGQGSSREHAALVPRYLGIKAVIAKSYARIHRKNLINFGIVPFILENEKDYSLIKEGESLELPDVFACIKNGRGEILSKKGRVSVLLDLSDKEKEVLFAGGLINLATKSCLVP